MTRSLSNKDRIAGVALLVAVVVLLFYLREPDETLDVRDLALLQPVSTLTQANLPGWQDAAEKYNAGLFSAAAKTYETILAEDDRESRRARVFLASAQIQTRRYDAAELILRPILTPGKPDSIEATARWLLAQVYLARNEAEPALDELKRLRGSDLYEESANAQRARVEAFLEENKPKGS